jgi:hypothetical protein
MLFGSFSLLPLAAVAIIMELASTWIRREMKLEKNGPLPLLSIMSRTIY